MNMKKFVVALAFFGSFAVLSAVLAQNEAQPGPAPATGRGAGRGARAGSGLSDPHIVSPRANKDLHPPDAPMLPNHFVAAR